jgi:alpha-L-rhamnosidase
MFPSNDCLEITNLRCEGKNNPLGIDITVPQLSWRIETSRCGTMQTAFQIQASADGDGLQKETRLAWDAKRVNSDRSIYIPYGGPLLSSGDRIYWRVRTWDNHGRLSSWSEPAWWEMGLLDPADWHGEWIEPNLKEDITRS